MIKRRKFLGQVATGMAISGFAMGKMEGDSRGSQGKIRMKPYTWEGPYAQFRTATKARHDPRLCADVRAPWMHPGSRIIIRSCEIVGYDTGFLYDDHYPPSEPNGRGKNYHHIPFTWNVPGLEGGLGADCVVPRKGKFWLRLLPEQDSVDIHLGVRNGLPGPMRNIEWHFCVVGFECSSIADPTLMRTYIFDGRHLRRLGEIIKETQCMKVGNKEYCGKKSEIVKVAGGHGFVPIDHQGLPVAPVEAKASVVIVEDVDKRHTMALGFQQSYSIYSDAIGNKCYHADPYFGSIDKTGEQRTMHGKLYLMKGTAQQAFERYRRDFGLSV